MLSSAVHRLNWLIRSKFLLVEASGAYHLLYARAKWALVREPPPPLSLSLSPFSPPFLDGVAGLIEYDSS